MSILHDAVECDKILKRMNASENENSDLEAKAKNIDVLYKSTLFKIQELGDRAFAILKSIRLKREAKKVQDLRNDLLN